MGEGGGGNNGQSFTSREGDPTHCSEILCATNVGDAEGAGEPKGPGEHTHGLMGRKPCTLGCEWAGGVKTHPLSLTLLLQSVLVLDLYLL